MKRWALPTMILVLLIGGLVLVGSLFLLKATPGPGSGDGRGIESDEVSAVRVSNSGGAGHGGDGGLDPAQGTGDRSTLGSSPTGTGGEVSQRNMVNGTTDSRSGADGSGEAAADGDGRTGLGRRNGLTRFAAEEGVDPDALSTEVELMREQLADRLAVKRQWSRLKGANAEAVRPTEAQAKAVDAVDAEVTELLAREIAVRRLKAETLRNEWEAAKSSGAGAGRLAALQEAIGQLAKDEYSLLGVAEASYRDGIKEILTEEQLALLSGSLTAEQVELLEGPGDE